jgi:hypothetical protein
MLAEKTNAELMVAIKNNMNFGEDLSELVEAREASEALRDGADAPTGDELTALNASIRTMHASESELGAAI